jgi:hypothetical protein
MSVPCLPAAMHVRTTQRRKTDQYTESNWFLSHCPTARAVRACTRRTGRSVWQEYNVPTRKRTHDSWQVLLHKTQGAPGHEHPTGFRVHVTSSCSCVPVAGVFNSRYAATYTTVHSVQWIPLALWAQVGLVQTAHKVEDNATEYSFIMPRIRPTIAL